MRVAWFFNLDGLIEYARMNERKFCSFLMSGIYNAFLQNASVFESIIVCPNLKKRITSGKHVRVIYTHLYPTLI